MALFDRFKSVKKGQAVKVVKIKKVSIDAGAMAGAGTAAGAAIVSRMFDQERCPTKILVVEDGMYSENVADYAFKMAQKLDCEIITLYVANPLLQFGQQRREEATALFFKNAEKAAAKFAAKALEMGVTVSHLMELGDSKKLVAKVSAQDAGVRYVLSVPEFRGTKAIYNLGQQMPALDLARESI